VNPSFLYLPLVDGFILTVHSRVHPKNRDSCNLPSHLLTFCAAVFSLGIERSLGIVYHLIFNAQINERSWNLSAADQRSLHSLSHVLISKRCRKMWETIIGY